MKILALEIPVKGMREEVCTPELLREEAAKVWELYTAGILRELYFRGDRPEAVLIMECEHVEAARVILGTLPLVRQKLINFEVIPLRAYPGFSRLFTGE